MVLDEAPRFTIDQAEPAEIVREAALDMARRVELLDVLARVLARDRAEVILKLPEPPRRI